jgi:sugar O-acyltransferase (sialic acid O-acetyltransferase NeuD family)
MPAVSISVVIYGASGFALAIADMIAHGIEPGAYAVSAYIDDFAGDQGRVLGAAPVIGFETWRSHHLDTPCIIAVGDPEARRRLAGRIAEAGGTFATIFRALGAVSPNIEVGEGSIIGFPAYVGPLTTIGRHVRVMPMAVIGHDVMLGDFVTVCSSASVAGYVVIEEGSFIGAGAVIVNGSLARPLRIGRGATVAAGAVVTKSVAAGVTVSGNPARPVREIAAERLARRVPR